MIIEGIDLIFTPADCTLCLECCSKIVDPDLFTESFWDLLLLLLLLLLVLLLLRQRQVVRSHLGTRGARRLCGLSRFHV